MKSRKCISFLLASALIAGALTGCSESAGSSAASRAPASSAAGAEASGKAKKIAFAPATMSNPYFQAIAQVVKDYVESKGDTFISVDPADDQTKMNDQIGDLVASGIDALLVGPHDTTSVKSALQLCKEKNVTVINFDAAVKDPSLVATIVATDNYSAGVMDAKDMMSRLPKGSKIAIIDNPSGSASTAREKGFLATIGDYFEVVSTLNGKGQKAITLPLAEDVIQSTPDLKAFFGVNDPTALGCVQALVAHQATGKILVYGVDGSPDAKTAIKDGKMTATAAQSPKTIGEKAIEAAYDVMAGKTVEKEITVPTSLISKENVDQYGTTGWQ